jgi:hypothetical protein
VNDNEFGDSRPGLKPSNRNRNVRGFFLHLLLLFICFVTLFLPVFFVLLLFTDMLVMCNLA